MQVKTFKYRLFPSKAQATRLSKTLDACRWLYNHFLDERKTAWETEKKSVSRYDQVNSIPNLKKDNECLLNVHSQVLQHIAVRLDLAFHAFFRRVKAGENPGYPRFKGKFQYDSFTYPQSGFKLLKNVVQLSKIGDVKIKLHRPVEGTIKTCTVKRSATGKWYITFSCNIDHTPDKQPVEPSIGIDMGLSTFATMSDGSKVENPRFFKHEQEALARVQRKFSKQEKGSKLRKKYRKQVARVHERIKWKRENFAHQESRKLINKYNTVCVEDLNINNMVKDNFRCMNKSIADTAWKQFLNFINYKAEWAGKRCISVNPAYTSQTCSRCGNRQKLMLSDRTYNCQCCGLSVDRDYNASLNIFSLGMQAMAGLCP